jgi:hypothetical protein
MHVFDSNGPEVRIRGTAHQVYEKYLGLARDASGSGDRVASENLLQHAEHYYRIILAQNEAERQARGGFDQPQPGMPNQGQTQNAPASDGGFGDEGDNPFDQSIGFAGSPNPFFAQQPPRVNAPHSGSNNGGGNHNNGGHQQGDRQNDRQQNAGSHGQSSGDRSYSNQSQGHGERPRRERYAQPQERGERNDRGASMDQPRMSAPSPEGAPSHGEAPPEHRDARSEVPSEVVRRPRRTRGPAGDGRARTDTPPADDAD